MPEVMPAYDPAALDALVMQGLTPYVTGAPGQSPQFQAAIEAFNAGTLPLIQQQLQLQGLGQSPIVAQTAAGALGQNLVPLLTADMQNRLAASGQLASYGQGKESLGLERELGMGRLGLDTELGRGNLALGQGRLGLDTTLGQGQLAQQARQLALERELGLGNLGLQRDLGMGNLGVSQRAQTLAEYMQPGQLAQQGQVSAANIAGQQADRQLQAYLGAGNLMLGLANPYGAAQQGLQNQQQMALTGYGQAGQAQQQTGQAGLDAQQADLLRMQALTQDMTTGLFGGSPLPPTLTQRSSTSSSK